MVYAYTTAYLRRRAHTLRIPDNVFDGCMTMGDLQTHVQAAYHTLAYRYHPDYVMTFQGRRSGYYFRRIAATYRFFMAFDRNAFLHRSAEDSGIWLEYHRLCAPLKYEMAWGNMQDVGEGWQVWS